MGGESVSPQVFRNTHRHSSQATERSDGRGVKWVRMNAHRYRNARQAMRQNVSTVHHIYVSPFQLQRTVIQKLLMKEARNKLTNISDIDQLQYVSWFPQVFKIIIYLWGNRPRIKSSFIKLRIVMVSVGWVYQMKTFIQQKHNSKKEKKKNQRNWMNPAKAFTSRKRTLADEVDKHEKTLIRVAFPIFIMQPEACSRQQQEYGYTSTSNLLQKSQISVKLLLQLCLKK